MECPLLVIGLFANSLTGGKFKPDTARCMEDDCAWYDDYDERCSIVSINYELANIAEEIEHLGRTDGIKD